MFCDFHKFVALENTSVGHLVKGSPTQITAQVIGHRPWGGINRMVCSTFFRNEVGQSTRLSAGRGVQKLFGIAQIGGASLKDVDKLDS